MEDKNSRIIQAYEMYMRAQNILQSGDINMPLKLAERVRSVALWMLWQLTQE